MYKVKSQNTVIGQGETRNNEEHCSNPSSIKKWCLVCLLGWFSMKKWVVDMHFFGSKSQFVQL